MTLNDYQTIADTARLLRLSIQRVQRAIEKLEITTHVFGSTTVIAKTDAPKIASAFKDGTIRRGRPVEKAEPSAKRRGTRNAKRSPR